MSPVSIVSIGGGGADGGIPEEPIGPTGPILPRRVEAIVLVEKTSGYIGTPIAPPPGTNYLLAIFPTPAGSGTWTFPGSGTDAQAMTLVGGAGESSPGFEVWGLADPILLPGRIEEAVGVGRLTLIALRNVSATPPVIATQSIGGVGNQGVSTSVTGVPRGLVIGVHVSSVGDLTITGPSESFIAKCLSGIGSVTRVLPATTGLVTISQTTPVNRRQVVIGFSFSPST
jgi:hypothetical protein